MQVYPLLSAFASGYNVRLFRESNLKDNLAELINRSLQNLGLLQDMDGTEVQQFQVEKTRDRKHGDWACNVALVLSRQLEKKPRELAELIVAKIPSSEFISRIDIAGPGFINFFLTPDAHLQVITEILDQQEKFGCSDTGSGKKILLEFVSANPTGPLHIGHGRGAAYGAALASLLEASGYQVDREYYINDSGRQMDILTSSIYLRYLQECGSNISLPVNAYQGDYIKPIARILHQQKGDTYCVDTGILESVLSTTTDPEEQLDSLIEQLQENPGKEAYEYIHRLGRDEIIRDIRNDLMEFGVEFDNWYSEKTLLDSGMVAQCMELLRQGGEVYEKDGATWFRSTAYGDEKDRVLIRENGQLTYFATDIAYHQTKFDRDYDRAIDIWGADHHGYIARVKAAMSALKHDSNALDILLVQFATLYRGEEKIQMSTRSGQFVTLRELRDEVGKDASRFFYVMRKSEQHLDFDLELAKSQSQDNPVYYIQYAHARICSVFRQAGERGNRVEFLDNARDMRLLENEQEQSLLVRLAAYPETVQSAAESYEPHQVCYYLRELANEFHTYYNAHQILVDDRALRDARLTLLGAIRQVIRNGLDLLGVSAPETM